AKGMIMARTDVSDDEAFDILRRASQRMNIKLREVAAQIVHPVPTENGATVMAHKARRRP
ncbi:MAG: ANTAR domain-containing protein, partial [Actinomycetota bacterium]|nr:ANTAR domain-containing protein [Actinomycetota bacterium]